MRRITTMLALAATLAIITLPARGALVTRDLTGVLDAASGSAADVGAGEISGFVTFDDSQGTPDLGGERFVLSDLEITFSNGPTLTLSSPELLVPVPPEIVVDASSGSLVVFDLSALGLSGFGLDPVLESFDLFFDPFDTSFSFSDSVTGSIVAEGRVSFPSTTAVTEPAGIALLALALGAAGWRRRRR